MNGAGNQFLAGARRADDEHVAVMARDLSGEIKNLQHSRAFADDAVKLKVLEELFF